VFSQNTAPSFGVDDASPHPFGGFCGVFATSTRPELRPPPPGGIRRNPPARKDLRRHTPHSGGRCFAHPADSAQPVPPSQVASSTPSEGAVFSDQPIQNTAPSVGGGFAGPPPDWGSRPTGPTGPPAAGRDGRDGPAVARCRAARPPSPAAGLLAHDPPDGLARCRAARPPSPARCRAARPPSPARCRAARPRSARRRPPAAGLLAHNTPDRGASAAHPARPAQSLPSAHEEALPLRRGVGPHNPQHPPRRYFQYVPQHRGLWRIRYNRIDRRIRRLSASPPLSVTTRTTRLISLFMLIVTSPQIDRTRLTIRIDRKHTSRIVITTPPINTTRLHPIPPLWWGSGSGRLCGLCRLNRLQRSTRLC
jgi:hypothetical protein